MLNAGIRNEFGKASSIGEETADTGPVWCRPNETRCPDSGCRRRCRGVTGVAVDERWLDRCSILYTGTQHRRSECVYKLSSFYVRALTYSEQVVRSNS